MHTDEWVKLSADEKVDHLRIELTAHAAILRCALLALERLGVTFDLGSADDGEREMRP